MELSSQRIEGYVGSLRDSEIKAYRIREADGAELGHLFKTRDSYTFAWYGLVDFTSLDFITESPFLMALFRDFNRFRFYRLPWPDDFSIIQRAKISLIVYKNELTIRPDLHLELPSPELNPELIQFEVVRKIEPIDPDFFIEVGAIGSQAFSDRQLPAAADIRENPERISFARVDLKLSNGIWEAAASFTAENPKTRAQGKSEIALKTPLSYRYPPPLLSRIAESIRDARQESEASTDDEFANAIRDQLSNLVYKDIG
jgi:hypothetical protein